MNLRTSTLLAGALLALTGCPDPTVDPDAGVPLPDPCNSVEDARNKAECNLPTTGTAVTDYVGTADDVDWFRIELPAGLTVRDLVKVRGIYNVPQTAVNLTLNVLRMNDDGTPGQAIGRVIDDHGQGAPRAVELTFPFPTTQPTRLLVQVSDERANPSRPNFDNRQPYTLTVERFVDSDANEPNDQTATAIPLDGTGAGFQTGLLTVANDVDLYSVNIPAPSGPRKILHVRLTAPLRSPPPPYRLMFVLSAPDGTPISENVVRAGGEFEAVEEATARLAQPGLWTVAVKGYKRIDDPRPVPGDQTYQYRLELRLLDEVDPTEPNDTRAQARVITLSAPEAAAVTLTGRLDHVPDPEWFRIDLPAHAAPTVLTYRVSPLAAGGRFAPLSEIPDRQVQLFSEITGFPTVPEAAVACRTPSAGVCPAGYLTSESAAFSDLVETMCNNYDPPRCLQSLRAEGPEHPGLKNFEGRVFVPPAASARSWYLLVQDLGNDWADDRDYQLEVRWRSDADEAGRFTGAVEQRAVVAMTEDLPTSASFPSPPAGASNVSGTISHGHGRIVNPDLVVDGLGVRGIGDYDAVPSDVDLYEFTLPAQDPAAGPLDRTWELEWTVAHYDGGQPFELGVEVTFCDGDRLDGGSCTLVPTAPAGPLVLAFSDAEVTSWHANPGALQPAWQRQVGASSTTTTAAAYGCFCFEPRFVRGGKLYVEVSAHDRVAHQPVGYTLRTALTSYPQSYPVEGGSMSCPPPLDGGVDGGPSGGCRFTD